MYIVTGNPIPHGLNGNFYSLDILRWRHKCKLENLGAISDGVHQQSKPDHRICNRGTLEADDHFVEGLVHVPGCLRRYLDGGSGGCAYGSRLAHPSWLIIHVLIILFQSTHCIKRAHGLASPFLR